MVLRHEGAYRHRQPNEAHPLRGGHRGERTRQPSAGSSPAWQERRVWGDAGYARQRERMRQCAPRAQDFTNKKGARHRALREEERAKNQKSKVRAKAEHAFHVIKRVFGFTKVCVGQSVHGPKASDVMRTGVVPLQSAARPIRTERKSSAQPASPAYINDINRFTGTINSRNMNCSDLP
jgi:hypothetical protein